MNTLFLPPFFCSLWYFLTWRLQEGRRDLKESLWCFLSRTGTPPSSLYWHGWYLIPSSFKCVLLNEWMRHILWTFSFQTPWFASSCDVILSPSHLLLSAFFSPLLIPFLSFLYHIFHGPGHLQQLNVVSHPNPEHAAEEYYIFHTSAPFSSLVLCSPPHLSPLCEPRLSLSFSSLKTHLPAPLSRGRPH